MRIVAACGNGMGTSMIIRIKVQNILKKKGVSASVDAMSVGQAKSEINTADVIICSTHLVDQFKQGKAKVVGVVNLMSDAEIEKALDSVL